VSDAQPHGPRPTGTVQVFCDESGGSDPASTAFLVAAAAISTADATRLVKSFRKATGFAGEVKGNKLTRAQRGAFLGLLARQADAASVVVACSRGNPVGGWAMSALPEAELYGHMLAEACLALPGLSLARHIAITLDRLRYTKARAELVRAGVAQTIAARHPAAGVGITFGDSAELAGLQVADVVANAAYQVIAPTPASEATAPLLATLIARSALMMDHVQLGGMRPAWLADVQTKEKPPEGGLKDASAIRRDPHLSD